MIVTFGSEYISDFETALKILKTRIDGIRQYHTHMVLERKGRYKLGGC